MTLLLDLLENSGDTISLEECERAVAGGCDVDARGSERRTALWFAVDRGRLDLVQFLIAKNADVNKSDDDGKTPLRCAVFHGHEKIVRLLLAAGAAVNKANSAKSTPLHVALSRDALACVKLLLAAGANPELQDADGRTAWNIAFKKKKTCLPIMYGAAVGQKRKTTESCEARRELLTVEADTATYEIARLREKYAGVGVLNSSTSDSATQS